MLGLTNELVLQLHDEPSAEVRKETAARVAGLYAGARLSPAERALAGEIIETLARDVEAEVRAALSQALRSCSDLPHHVALSLAEDVDTVALPMLRYSEALTDADLIALVRAGSTARRVAVANREIVSGRVADALIDTRDDAAIGALLANGGAEIAEGALHRALDTVELSTLAHGVMAKRARLPASVVARLVETVSETLRAGLIERYEISPALSAKLAAGADEDALVKALTRSGSSVQTDAMIRQLKAKGHFTPTFLLRILCAGNLGLFQEAMATLADMPTAEACRLTARGAGGFRLLYRKAALPPMLHGAFSAALEEVQAAGEHGDGAGAAARIVDRLLGEYRTIRRGDLDQVLHQLARLPA